MKNFNELKTNDLIKIKDYTLKITRYNEDLKGYHCEGKKKNDFNTYLTLLVTEEDYTKLDDVSRLYCVPFNKDCEVL